MPRQPFSISPKDLERIDDPVVRSALQDMYRVLNAQSASLAGAYDPWRDVPFNAADFFSLDVANAAAGTWVVTAPDVVCFQYRRLGYDTLIVQFNLTGASSAGGAKAKLCIKIPGGFIANPTSFHTGVLTASDLTGAASSHICFANGIGGPTNAIECFKVPLVTNWGNGINISVQGAIVFKLADPAGH